MTFQQCCNCDKVVIADDAKVIAYGLVFCSQACVDDYEDEVIKNDRFPDEDLTR